MHKLKISSFIALIVMLFSGLSAPAYSSEHDLHILTYADPPYVYPQGDSEQGLAVLLIKELMALSEYSYTLNILPAKRALLLALSTQNTCVFPIERSQEREVQFSWVSPVLISRHGLFKRPGGLGKKIRVIRDVQNSTLGTYLGSGIGEYLRGLGFYVEETANNESNIYKLMANRIDFWASDILSARYIANKEKISLGEPELIFFTSLRAMGCHPSLSSRKITHLNQTLKTMYQDGTIEKMKRGFKLISN